MYLQLFSAYFEIAKLSENTGNLRVALDVSKQRLERAKYQYEYGQTTKLELLNAEVDVNNDSINYSTSQQSFRNAKRDLNVVLGDQKGIAYSVETDVDFIVLQPYEDLLSKAYETNAVLNQNEKNLAISALNIKFNKANYLPRVDLSGSYGWNQNINPPTSFVAASQSTGLNAGINLTWNLFDGGGTKTRVANAKIALENQKLLVQQQKETLENTLKNTYESYTNALFILEAQKQNVATNTNNFERTQERYKLGQVSSIEFRQAQINLLNAQTAMNNAKYDAKLIELQLLQLSGELLDVAL